MKIDNKDLLKLLKKLEWSGMEIGQPSYMGSEDGRKYLACPICYGIFPKEKCYEAYEIGHTKSCKLNKYIIELSK